MNLKETKQIMAVLRGAYPNSRDIDAEQAQVTVMVWYNALKEYPYTVVQKAIESLITTNKFQPAIAEVISMINTIYHSGNHRTEQDAWNCVRKALTNGYYGYREEYNKLPEDVQKVIGSPSILREWSMIDTNTLNTVTASNFMRAYRAFAQEDALYLSLPSEVKQIMSGNTLDLLE